jgi:hypothetical protein
VFDGMGEFSSSFEKEIVVAGGQGPILRNIPD